MGKKTRYYRNISCSFCNTPEFDRQHLISHCYLAKKTSQLLSTKLNLTLNYTDWVTLLSQKWKRGRIIKEGPKFLIFSLFLTELYYQFYKKAADNSYYIDYKITTFNILKKINDHIKIAIKLNYNNLFIENLKLICNS